MSVTYATDTH